MRPQNKFILKLDFHFIVAFYNSSKILLVRLINHFGIIRENSCNSWRKTLRVTKKVVSLHLILN